MNNTIDFLSIFEAVPGNDLLVKADPPKFSILAATESYTITTGRSKSELIGKGVFEAFPSNPSELNNSGVNNLLASFTQVINNRKSHQLPIQRYDVVDGDGHFEEKFWSISNTPVLDRAGNVAYIINTAEDITREVNARKREDQIKGLEKAHNLLMNAPVAIAILKGPELNVELANEHILKLWGRGKEVLKRPIVDSIPEIEEQGFINLLKEVRETGIAYEAYETPAKLIIKGKEELVYFNFVYQPYFEDDITKAVGVLIFASDVTDKVLAKRKVEESDHRYQNMINSSHSAIGILKGENLIITTANSALIDILGKGDDIIGKPYFELMPELIAQRYKEVYYDVYTTGKTFIAKEMPVHISRFGNMELRYYDFILQAQRNVAGEIDGIGIIATEVTSQAQFNLHIKESEERFRMLADNIPLITFIIEPTETATISYWNKTWLDYTGQSFDEAIGRSWDGILHPDDLIAVLDAYIPAFGKCEPYFLPAVRLKRFDGQYRWHFVKSNPRILPNGEFMGYIGVIFDIHESKVAEDALKESEEHFRQMADLMPAKISNASPDGAVTYYNKSWLDYTGMSFKELQDFGYHNIIHPGELQEFLRLFQVATVTGTVLEMEMRFRNKEGEYIWHLNRASPVMNESGHIKMWIGVTTEIQKIKEEEQLKDNFLSMASHELKTPVTTIKAYGQIAESILEAKGDLKTLGLVQNMGKQVNKLTTLINDLLDITKIQKGRLIYTEVFFDFTELIKEVIDDMQKTSFTHKIISDLDDSPKVFGDKDKISQVLNNLISNAIKYSPRSDKILITTQVENDGVKLSVQDFGIGISEKEQEHVFEQFYRVSGENQSTFPGMGIGLYICLEIIKSHGGKIWVESGINMGSTFYIWLPFDHRKVSNH